MGITKEEKERRIREKCKILGIEYDPILMEDIHLYEEFNQSFTKKKARAKRIGNLDKFMNGNNLDKVEARQQEGLLFEETEIKKELPLKETKVKEKLPIKKLLINGDRLSIEGQELKISAYMCEGFTFTDKEGKEKQVPEITIRFERSFDFKDMAVGQMSREMAMGKRPINKSINSVIVNNLGSNTIYPNSFEMAIDHLNKNFENRLSKYFNFNLDFSDIGKSRMKKIFERSFSGSRLMTTVCEVYSA